MRIEDRIAVKEEDVRRGRPLPPCVPGSRGSLDSSMKNDDLGTEFAGGSLDFRRLRRNQRRLILPYLPALREAHRLQATSQAFAFIPADDHDGKRRRHPALCRKPIYVMQGR